MPSDYRSSVCSAIRASGGFIGHGPIDLLHSTHPPLLTLVDHGPDADRLEKIHPRHCRVQAPVLQNTILTRSPYGLNPRYASSPRDGAFSRPLYRRFAPLYRHRHLISYILVVSLPFCSRGPRLNRGIPWTIAHQPSKRDDDSHQNTVLPTEAKLLCALWNKLFLSAPRIRSRMLHDWNLQNLITRHIASINRSLSTFATLPFYPAYDSRKNVGYATQMGHLGVVGLSPFLNLGTTSLDLLRLYLYEGHHFW